MKKILLAIMLVVITAGANAQAYFVVKDSCDVIDVNENSTKVASPVNMIGIKDGVVILNSVEENKGFWKTMICKDKPDIDSGSLTYWDMQNDGRAKCLKIDLDRGWIVFREWIAKDVSKETYFFTIDREVTRMANQESNKSE